MNFNESDYLDWKNSFMNTMKEKINELVNNINTVKDDIDTNGWKGSSSKNFSSKIGTYLENLKVLQNDIDKFEENVTSCYGQQKSLEEDTGTGVQ